MKKIKGIFIGLCFLILIAPPLNQISHAHEVISSSFLPEFQAVDDIQLDYYHFNGITYSKETRKIPLEQAKQIKEQFAIIDASNDAQAERFQEKHDVLCSHDLILAQNLELTSHNNTVQNDRGVGLFFSKVTGFFGPCSINLLSVFFAAPFFISRAHGISVHISGSYYPSFDFVSFQPVKIKLLGFIGAIIVFPFLSIGGYIDGVAILGSIQEIDKSI